MALACRRRQRSNYFRTVCKGGTDAAGALTRVSDDDAAAVIVLTGPDLHQFKLVYERLSHAADRCIKEKEKEE